MSSVDGGVIGPARELLLAGSVEHNGELTMRLIPTDDEFFGMLSELVARLAKAARLLEELLGSLSEAPQLISAIKDVEHDADRITRVVNERLSRSLVPPFESGDIHTLANRLDNVIDLLDGTAQRVAIFHIDDIPPAARRFGRLIVESTDHLNSAIKGLRSKGARRFVTLDTVAVKRLEEDGDDVYTEAVSRLFEPDSDPIYVLKWKELYDRLEKTLDECQHVAQVIESIALKYS